MTEGHQTFSTSTFRTSTASCTLSYPLNRRPTIRYRATPLCRADYTLGRATYLLAVDVHGVERLLYALVAGKSSILLVLDPRRLPTATPLTTTDLRQLTDCHLLTHTVVRDTLVSEKYLNVHPKMSCNFKCDALDSSAYTQNRFTALLDFVWDYPGEPVPER